MHFSSATYSVGRTLTSLMFLGTVAVFFERIFVQFFLVFAFPYRSHFDSSSRKPEGAPAATIPRAEQLASTYPEMNSALPVEEPADDTDVANPAAKLLQRSSSRSRRHSRRYRKRLAQLQPQCALLRMLPYGQPLVFVHIAFRSSG